MMFGRVCGRVGVWWERDRRDKAGQGRGMAGVLVLFLPPLLSLWVVLLSPSSFGLVLFPPFILWEGAAFRPSHFGGYCSFLSFLEAASPSPWSWCCPGSALDLSFRFVCFPMLFSCLWSFFVSLSLFVCSLLIFSNSISFFNFHFLFSFFISFSFFFWKKENWSGSTRRVHPKSRALGSSQTTCAWLLVVVLPTRSKPTRLSSTSPRRRTYRGSNHHKSPAVWVSDSPLSPSLTAR